MKWAAPPYQHLPYKAQHVLTDNFPCDFTYLVPQFFTNYYIPSDAYVGDLLTLDLGCLADVTGLRLKNTHNNNWGDRGLKDFLVKLSTNNADWNLAFAKDNFVIDGSAEQTHRKCFFNGPEVKFVEPEVKSVSTSVRPNLARYVGIEALSYYHVGAGLSSVEVEVDNGGRVEYDYFKLDISYLDWFKWTYKTDTDPFSYIECGHLCSAEGDICTMHFHYDGVCYLNNMRETHHRLITESPNPGISTGFVKKSKSINAI